MPVHVDRGGTFTDVVKVVGAHVEIAKVPSDVAVIGDFVAPGAVDSALTFGTTVATNALLERRGVRTLLVVDAGFEDLVYLREMARPELFDPDADWPPTLASAIVGVAPDDTGDAIDVAGFEAIAVVLHDADREVVLARTLAARAPGAYLALGHRTSRDPGALARIETTLVDAAVTPILRRALDRDRIPPGALAMRSDGSLVPALDLAAPDAVLSGPAGGVLATLATAQQAGFVRAVGLDMGGTSTDVCLVDAAVGPPRREGDLEVAGVRLRRAMLEVETIAAGGGSILTADELGLAVGPRSAGADPGPQCYGRGGPPTLTDAAVVLGLVDPARFPIALAPERIALPGDGTPVERAAAFVAVAHEAMAAAVRRLAMARGVDLVDHALVAYGGAGAQHAAAVAERLGIQTVLVHPAASVFCAYGQALARRSEVSRAPLSGPLDALAPELAARFAALVAELGREDRGAAARIPSADWLAPERAIVLGHAGTDHPLEVPLAAGPLEASAIAAAFHDAHARRYGFARDLPIEVFALVVRRTMRSPAPPRVASGADPLLMATAPLVGPAVLHAPTTSVVVPAGWIARTRDGLLRLDRDESARVNALASAHDDALALELWQARLRAIATEAGVVLARLARSVSIRERHDFSCAIFDRDGRLVTNAPHIPVHLGAMGDTVRDIVAHLPPDATGGAWLSNDPRAGGSHLPDLTVVTLVRAGPERFFVASRGHHVDVGGIARGSMPVASRTLAEEGACFLRVPLVADGVLAPLHAIASASRQPDVVAADLEAQLAANAHMARRLSELMGSRSAAFAHELDPRALARACEAIHAHARRTTAALVKTLPEGTHTASDDIDGIPLALAIRRSGDRLVFDFRGAGPPHPSNLNTPRAVVRAAVLYALRVAAGALGTRDLPLNDGTLEDVEILTHAPSILAPPPDAAIVGGNVETSQRLVDLVFSALGLRAPSAGTMNNLVLARSPADPDPREWAFYETLGGGFGATPSGPGRSARQLHMTNTRATDPEVLALRLPLRVVRFAIRRGSGGAGLHTGGDGLVRELEVTRPATASLLAAWRPGGAPGLAGGGSGAPGRAFVVRAGVTHPWGGASIELAPGDRVRVETPGGGGWGPPSVRPPSDPLISNDNEDAP